MNQPRKVVLLQARLSKDEDSSLLNISGSLSHGLPQRFGVTTAAHHAPSCAAHQQGRQAQQYRGCTQSHTEVMDLSLKTTCEAARALDVQSFWL